MPRRSWVRDASLMALAYGTVSFLVMKAIAFGYPTGAVFWPGAGLTVGILLRLSRERWPALLAGVFVAEVLVDLTVPVSFGVAVIWAVANTVEPLVGASLLLRGGRPAGLTSVSLVVRFVLLTVAAGPLVGATVGAVAAVIAGVEPFWPTWPRWWIGDAVGVLVVAPAMFTRRRVDLAKARRHERWLLLLGLAAVTLVATFPWQVDAWVQGLPFLLAPALVLVAMRLGPLTSVISLAVSATTVNTITALGIGPFAASGTYAGLVVAQVCLAGGAFALLTVSAFNYNLVSVQRLEDILREQALHDGLTGLANRRLLDDRIKSALAGLDRSSAHLAVLIVDLDGFKQVNDAYGHLAGDAVLVEVADRLRACVRPADTVARTGGDEFVVVLPDVSDLSVAEAFRARVSGVLNQPMRWGDTELQVRASVGMSSTDDPSAPVDGILAAADRAMYASKTASAAGSPPLTRESTE